MISKLHRFHGRTSLGYVYRQGKQLRTQSMALKFAANPRRKTYRCAVVVGKKVNKSAVVRNRIRRRIYEIVRQQNITEPYDLVFTVFSEEVAGLPADKLKDPVEKLLLDAKVVTRSS